MRILGLHLLDWTILVVYFLVIVWIGVRTKRRVRDTKDFYQGNRSFGKVLTAFLNFGNMTDAGQVAGVTREIYRQGLSGIWFSNLVLFHTPFQWFIAAWQRRARYIGPGDMFLHRYESRFLAGLYATILILAAAYGNTFGFILTGKTLQAMMVVPPQEYSAAEQASVDGFERLKELRELDYQSLQVNQQTELQQLTEREGRGELNAFISYIDLPTFYILYAILIAGYTILGGLFAIALVDVIQGILIVFLSLILIPLGLSAIGGIAGLQQKVPEGMTQLFGSGGGSEYTWYYVGAFALLNLVVNAPKSFTLGGSPKDDRAARIGFVSGAISKRFMMLGWAFTGLIAVGLYAGSVADPTNIWGVMTTDLLGVGAVGLMIAAIFSANMDGAATGSLDASAAFIKNIWEPIRPGTSERQQVILGRIIVALILGGTVFFSLTTFDDIVSVFKYALSIGAIVGPAFWMAYFWRRVNTRAVAVQMIISLIITILLPNLVPAFADLKRNEHLVATTTEQIVEREAPATGEDVTAGKADSVGQTILRTERIPPEPIFFDRIERVAPPPSDFDRHVNEYFAAHPEIDSVAGRSLLRAALPFMSPGEPIVEGGGLFRANIWILDAIGFNFSNWSKSEIGTAGFLFDAILPFILLIIISLVTRPNSEPVLRDFYARINTPAVADPVEDARRVQEKIENPELVEQNKMFPHTSIELWKPTRFDILGFVACVAFVLGIIGLYMLLSSLARG